MQETGPTVYHCKVHNLLQPFEVSNYHLFVILSAKNRNIFQFYSETASLPLTLHVERWHVERWSKDVAYARNTESGCNLHPVCLFIPESVFYTESVFSTQSVMLSPRFIPQSVFYIQSVVRSP